ncbi:DEAD-box ATP-dependent RNA helicase 36 [Olea europaea subsp. europaea]|uniref:DEAD-box ATP-dependent RNA helicase 36 n=1 Tax=Olea europaea subsp. europaea TaxID=158383 RepID=A0A8S0R781_OLEEU|nr:DEAD-box ATP-dependent RNA helicase 36 [Olea europaea subsp. europaea]
MEEMEIRSAIIFVSTCRSCELLSLLVEELEVEVAALHSFKSQSLRLSALHKFKSCQVPVLLATDVASRGMLGIMFTVLGVLQEPEEEAWLLALSPRFTKPGA